MAKSQTFDASETPEVVARPRAPKTIPALPCLSIDETLDFWSGLGFAITYRQKAPNLYRRGQAGRVRVALLRAEGPPTRRRPSVRCFVMVSDVESGCMRNSRQAWGERPSGDLPAKGLPRISRMRPGQTRFTLTDPKRIVGHDFIK